jgi:hypothetical protein
MSNANSSFIHIVLFTVAMLYDPHASVFFGGTGETKDEKMKADCFQLDTATRRDMVK